MCSSENDSWHQRVQNHQQDLASGTDASTFVQDSSGGRIRNQHPDHAMGSDGSQYMIGRSGAPSGIVRDQQANLPPPSDGSWSGIRVAVTLQMSARDVQQNYALGNSIPRSTNGMSQIRQSRVPNPPSQHSHHSNVRNSVFSTTAPAAGAQFQGSRHSAIQTSLAILE